MPASKDLTYQIQDAFGGRINIVGGHGIQILDVVVEVHRILALKLHPKWHLREKILFSEFRKFLKLRSVRTIKKFPKPEKIVSIAMASSIDLQAITEMLLCN